jgi:hypothetical protein
MPITRSQLKSSKIGKVISKKRHTTTKKTTTKRVNTNVYNQLVVWQGMVIKPDEAREFENWMKDEFKTRVKFEGQVTTLPGQDGPGGRSDAFFYIHDDDTSSFAMMKLQLRLKGEHVIWWEDIFHNDNEYIYPLEFRKSHNPKW